MNLYEKFIQAIKPTWEDSEPFPRYEDRDEGSFRVLHLTQAEFEFLKDFIREEIRTDEFLVSVSTNLPRDRKYFKWAKKRNKTLSEIQRKLKNESRP